MQPEQAAASAAWTPNPTVLHEDLLFARNAISHQIIRILSNEFVAQWRQVTKIGSSHDDFCASGHI
jgi:hypothetical protein